MVSQYHDGKSFTAVLYLKEDMVSLEAGPAHETESQKPSKTWNWLYQGEEPMKALD